jgi:primase-polymerase (primpol)-like protein
VIEPVHDRDRAWLPVIITTIPNLLRERDQWVGWRAEQRHGKWAKTPVMIANPRQYARVDAPSTWGGFADAVDAYSCALLQLDGIGYVLTRADGLVGVDLDKCRDPGTGAIESWALAFVRLIKPPRGHCSSPIAPARERSRMTPRSDRRTARDE